jgi:hypothetical protein
MLFCEPSSHNHWQLLRLMLLLVLMLMLLLLEAAAGLLGGQLYGCLPWHASDVLPQACLDLVTSIFSLGCCHHSLQHVTRRVRSSPSIIQQTGTADILGPCTLDITT